MANTSAVQHDTGANADLSVRYTDNQDGTFSQAISAQNTNVATGDTGAKVATFNGATQVNTSARGAWITILLGTVTGTTPTLSAQLQYSPDGGTTWINFGPALANLTTTGQQGLIIVYPTNISQAAGVTPANLTSGAFAMMAINAALPKHWRIVYTIGGTTPSFTISSVNVQYTF